MIHFGQEKTGIKKRGTEATRRWKAVGGGWRIKRTQKITKAFDRQVQYKGRRRAYGVGGCNAGAGGGGVFGNDGGRSEEMTENVRQR